jgi:[histone H3]-lysine36 N-dimethyltransferase SETMAR
MSEEAGSSLKMDISRRELRVLLLHEYRLGHKATEAASNICSTMGKDVLSIRTAQHWFQEFKNGNVDLDDSRRSGRPPEIDVDVLKQLIEEDPRLTTRCLAERLGCSHTAVEKHLKELGKIWKYGVWIPHELSPLQLQQRVDSCMELLTSHRTHEWLRNLITGDEKWVLYINHTRKRQWLEVGQSGIATPKNDLHPKMVMLSVWWSAGGVIHWELLPTGSTISADFYCEQLDRVAAKLQGKLDKVYFLHDNARPHIAKSTREKLLKLGWTTLPHPPYSPDLAPTDYHLFHSLADHLREKQFDEENDLKTYLGNFFNQKSQDFYKRGIFSLPERWRQVVDSNGAYIDET